jgi:hypothetical protein
MGYTHYWRRGTGEVTEERIAAADKAIQGILDNSKDIIANGSGDKGTSPHKEETYYAFNGLSEGGQRHETALLCRDPKHLKDFEFCKTARKDYDEVVVACLAIQTLFYGPAIAVSSDGGPEDWEQGFELAEKHLSPRDIDSAARNAAGSEFARGFAAYLLEHN